MKPEDLILSIVKAYQAARKPYHKHERVRRGRSHSISSITEDLIAEFLATNDSSIDVIYVDQPIFIEKIKKQLYPDITIVRDGVIESFIDIKMDIGWNRQGLTDLCKAHYKIIRSIKGSECRMRDGLTKDLRALKISKSISYNVVLISRTNISPKILHTHEEKKQKLNPDVELFVLCDTGHPNTYGKTPKEIVKGLSISKESFKRLKNKLHK